MRFSSVVIVFARAFSVRVAGAACPTASPPVWPAQFVVVQRRIPDDDSGNATVVTYYDWTRGANLLVITNDNDEANPLHDLELTTGHSYYFTPSQSTCQPMRFPVGILRPDWLANATFLGEQDFLNRRVLAWTKADFIDYFADPDDCTPVSWYFHSMQARFDTVFYTTTLPPNVDALFAPPAYCNASLVSPARNM